MLWRQMLLALSVQVYTCGCYTLTLYRRGCYTLTQYTCGCYTLILYTRGCYTLTLYTHGCYTLTHVVSYGPPLLGLQLFVFRSTGYS